MTKQHTILLVEDDVTLSDAFSLMLTKEGFKAVLAFNGSEALEQLKHTTVDLILLDLLMPVMDGREFLRTFANERHIPIIVFSNLDTRDDVQEILALGANRYMLKAWASPRELVQVIKDTIG